MAKTGLGRETFGKMVGGGLKKKIQIELRGGLREQHAVDKLAPASRAPAVEPAEGGSGCLLSN